MTSKINRDHALYGLFFDEISQCIVEYVASTGHEDACVYLTDLLAGCTHADAVFSVRTRTGSKVETVSEMLAEADVRLNADSFERERQVHQHIADFILFWTGVQPQYLSQIRIWNGESLTCDYTRQGRESYHLVSTYEDLKKAGSGSVFRKLSEGFNDYAFCLKVVRSRLNLMPEIPN